MNKTLCDLIAESRARKFATDAGTHMHERLRKITIDGQNISGDTTLAEKIINLDGCAKYFTPAAKTEVPIAGTINGKFISRRIDRMIIDNATQTICSLDYKTDINPDAFRYKYIAQLREYRELLKAVFPGHAISAAILWTHNWQLENL